MGISMYLVLKISFQGTQSRTSVFSVLHGLVCIPSTYGSAPLVSTRISPQFTRSVPTSFVPPAHNQGVDLAFNQGQAPRSLFLSTTGSFFVIAVFALSAAAPFGGRFPAAFGSLLSQLLLFFTAGFSYPYGIVQSNREDIYFLCCCWCLLRSVDIFQHLRATISDILGRYGVKDSDELTGNRYQRLHLLQRVLWPRRVILVQRLKRFISSNHRYCCLKHYIAQALASSVADVCLAFMFSGTV